MIKGYVCQGGGIIKTVQKNLSTKERFQVIRTYNQAIVKYVD